MTYSVAWHAGSSAQIELFSADAKGETDSFRFKFNPSMRKTLRPPMSDLVLGERALQPIREILDNLVSLVDARGSNVSTTSPPTSSITEHARDAGYKLMNLVLPDDVNAELSANEDLFLEIGLDEKLLEYPWELMYDEKGFLCCRHSIGRFVNVTNPTPLPRMTPARFASGPLRILLISVPQPLPRVGPPPLIHPPLRGALSETRAIVDTLTAGATSDVELTPLTGAQATWNSVFNTINNSERFHIVHFNGHAFFDEEKPHHSGLVLHDKDMDPGTLFQLFRSRPPVLFFMNACETAMAHAGQPWKNRYDIFGLARAFLNTGAYLLGTRWKVGDDAAAAFASAFYKGILRGTPLGTVVRDSRFETFTIAQTTNSDDFSWASYSYYGDPRLYFRKEPPVAVALTTGITETS